MNKKRSVILFGAGAIKGWNGVQTNELTELVLNSGPAFVCNDTGSSLMEFINNAFIQSDYKKEEINFETLINAIEELIILLLFRQKK